MSGEEYVEMIEIPVNSCEVVSAPRKKRLTVKGLLGKKGFFERKGAKKSRAPIVSTADVGEENLIAETRKEEEASFTPEQTVLSKAEKENESGRAKWSFGVVGVQVALIIFLVAAIFVTNIVWADSGMNVMMREFFGTENELDERAHTAFTPYSPIKNGSVTVENGVMKLAKGAVYPPVDGVVSAVEEKDGYYTVTINHSDVFRTVFSGLKYVYAQKGDKAYTGVPVGYAEALAEAAMYESDSVVTDYTVENGGIVWQK